MSEYYAARASSICHLFYGKCKKSIFKCTQLHAWVTLSLMSHSTPPIAAILARYLRYHGPLQRND